MYEKIKPRQEKTKMNDQASFLLCHNKVAVDCPDCGTPYSGKAPSILPENKVLYKCGSCGIQFTVSTDAVDITAWKATGVPIGRGRSKPAAESGEAGNALIADARQRSGVAEPDAVEPGDELVADAQGRVDAGSVQGL